MGLVPARYSPEGTAEFYRQYWEILSGRAQEARTSWGALIKSYRASDRWTGLKQRTRQDYERVLLYILEKNGPKDMTRLQRKDAIAAMQANPHRVRFANSIPAVMTVLCEHAIDIGWMRENPAKGVRKIEMPADKRKPHTPWTDAAIRKMRDEGEPLPLLIFELGIGTVQRPGDLLGFTWGDYDGNCLELRQNKTDKPLRLPCPPPLNVALESARSGLGFAPHPLRRILTGKRGGPLSDRDLGRLMLRERRRLGLEAFDLHALRYRGVMELAWAGCDDDEIMSYSGHSTKAMVRKYAGEARQIMRARQARAKRS